MAEEDRESSLGEWIEKPSREIGSQRYQRFVVRTHLVRAGERLERTLLPHFVGKIQPGDIIVIGEKIIAIAEGRAVLVKSIKPRPLARFLSRHVRQLGYGMGLRREETMEMAIREVGMRRILFAAMVGAADRVLGRSGNFYRVAGRQVAAIDGPGPTTIPPFNQYIVLAPKKAQNIVDALSRRLGVEVAVVDVNDVGSEVLAYSSGLQKEVIEELLRDNPMGQGAQRTPVGILRPIPMTRQEKPWPDVLPLSQSGGFMIPVPGFGDGDFVWSGEEVAPTTNLDPEVPSNKKRHGKVDPPRL